MLPLGTLWRRWEDSTTTILEVWSGPRHVTRLRGPVIELRVPQKTTNFVTNLVLFTPQEGFCSVELRRLIVLVLFIMLLTSLRKKQNESVQAIFFRSGMFQHPIPNCNYDGLKCGTRSHFRLRQSGAATVDTWWSDRVRIIQSCDLNISWAVKHLSYLSYGECVHHESDLHPPPPSRHISTHETSHC
jgi:hypothetical protein